MGNTVNPLEQSGKNIAEKLPEQQARLAQALQAEFAEFLTPLPPHAWREYGLSYQVSSDLAFAVFRKLRDGQSFLFNMLIDITCVDWLDQSDKRFEIVYHLLSLSYNHRVCIKIPVSEDQAEVESVRSLWPAANFLEREVWDMFGIKFSGHGDLRRILLYEEFVGHPLRKDYPLKGKQPRVPLRVPELRNTSEDMIREELVSFPTKSRADKPRPD